MNWRKILRLLTPAAILTTAGSILIAYCGFQNQNQWNRKQQTLTLISEVNKQLKEIKPAMHTAFPKLYAPGAEPVMSQKDAEALYSACFSNISSFECKKRSTAIEYLNILENISVAYINDIAEKSLVKNSLGGLITEDYKYFEPFIHYYETARKRKAWGPLQDAVIEINKK